MDKARFSGRTRLNMRVRGCSDAPVARVSFIMWTGISTMANGRTIEQMALVFIRQYKELCTLANG